MRLAYAWVRSASLQFLRGVNRMVLLLISNDVLVASLGAIGEFSCLVSEDGFSGVVHFCVDVVFFVAMELGGMEFFKRMLWLGGANILASLVDVLLWCFNFSE